MEGTAFKALGQAIFGHESARALFCGGADIDHGRGVIVDEFGKVGQPGRAGGTRAQEQPGQQAD